MLSPKRLEFPLEPHHVNKLDEYEDFSAHDDGFGEVTEPLGLTPKLPTSDLEDRHYSAFSTNVWRFAAWLFENSLKNMDLPASGVVIKSSWTSMTTQIIKPKLLNDRNGLFGIHHYSSLASDGNSSLAPSHLFLPRPDDNPSTYHWIISKKAPPENNRALLVYVSAYVGHSLVTANNPGVLIEAGFHACLGWFNMVQQGYLHRDITIGSMVMLDDDVRTRAFEIIKPEKKTGKDETVEGITKMLDKLDISSWEDKLVAGVQEMGIENHCRSFVIDGDLAIKLVSDHFEKELVGFRSDTYHFMSDGLLNASRNSIPYLQSPIDDLFSHFYTMQWAAAFNTQEFHDDEGVPRLLNVLRNELSGGIHRERALLKITNCRPLRSREYGRFVASLQPFLRDWHSSLQMLDAEWEECQFQLEKAQAEVRGSAYTYLLGAFAVKGVAQLAELILTHTAKRRD